MSWLTTNRADCDERGMVNGDNITDAEKQDNGDSVEKEQAVDESWRNWSGCST